MNEILIQCNQTNLKKTLATIEQVMPDVRWHGSFNLVPTSITPGRDEVILQVKDTVLNWVVVPDDIRPKLSIISAEEYIARNYLKLKEFKEAIEKRACGYGNTQYPLKHGEIGAANDFINGALSDEAKNYWEEYFKY